VASNIEESDLFMTRQKILLVDDEQDILELVGYNLEKEGFEVHTASNGIQAIEKAKAVIPT
jgi:two-component system alkaline phosphatase synthesis response regulator PhoP